MSAPLRFRFNMNQKKTVWLAWLALAAIGQAASLRMIDAGPLLRYQHYHSISWLIENRPWTLILVAAQGLLVLLGMRPHRPAIVRWIRQNLRPWQWLGIGVVFVVTSATVSREIGAYLQELPLAALIQALNLANLYLVAATLPQAAMDKVRRWSASLKAPVREGRFDRVAWGGALWVTGVAVLLCVFSYERQPHMVDEVAYLYHARYLAAGMLTMPAPPVAEAFNYDLMEVEGDRWYAAPPPGWPLVLALGVLVGLPWLVNPLLAGVNVLLSFALVKKLYDREMACWAVLLLCVSPWHLFMAMNMLTHTATLTFALLAAVSVVWAREANPLRWAIVSGLATGMVSLIRPLEGLILAASLGLWILGFGGKRLKPAAIAAWLVGCAFVGGLVFPYNQLLTGKASLFPIMAYTDKHDHPNANALGFGPDRGMNWPLDPFPGHGLADAAVNANLNITSINIELFGWGIGSLLFLSIFFLTRGKRRSDYLLLWLMGAIFIAHIFYWFSGGPDFSARYWYLMILPCIVLSARGLRWVADKLGEGSRAEAMVLLSCLLASINFIPWRATDKYYHYLGVRTDIRQLAKERQFGKSLVLIQGKRFPDFASAIVYNPLDLNADAPIYAWEADAAVRTEVLRAYADRPVWVIAGPTITGDGFKVVEGPIPAEQMLNRP